jgi:hypothetical protein
MGVFDRLARKERGLDKLVSCVRFDFFASG